MFISVVLGAHYLSLLIYRLYFVRIFKLCLSNVTYTVLYLCSSVIFRFFLMFNACNLLNYIPYMLGFLSYFATSQLLLSLIPNLPSFQRSCDLCLNVCYLLYSFILLYTGEEDGALLLFKNGTIPEIKQEPMDTDIKVEVDSNDEDCNMMLGPSVLGLLRVGESPSPQKSQVILNRRGMVSPFAF